MRGGSFVLASRSRTDLTLRCAARARVPKRERRAGSRAQAGPHHLQRAVAFRDHDAASAADSFVYDLRDASGFRHLRAHGSCSPSALPRRRGGQARRNHGRSQRRIASPRRGRCSAAAPRIRRGPGSPGSSCGVLRPPAQSLAVSLRDAFRNVRDALEAVGVPYMATRSIASSVHGRCDPRGARMGEARRVRASDPRRCRDHRNPRRNARHCVRRALGGGSGHRGSTACSTSESRLTSRSRLRPGSPICLRPLQACRNVARCVSNTPGPA